MIPANFYMTDLGKMAYVAIYLPMVLGLFWWLYRKLKSLWPLLIALALVLLTLPFWDVYLISRDADRLCKEQGGLHVYKTVEANSFRGGGDIVKLNKYGFVYAESYGFGGLKFRYTAQESKWVEKMIDEFTTRFEIGGRGYEIINNKIASNAIRMVDLETGEVLGEIVTLNILPGMFDEGVLNLTGSGPVIWHCGEEQIVERTSFDELILATLKPKQSEGGAP